MKTYLNHELIDSNYEEHKLFYKHGIIAAPDKQEFYRCSKCNIFIMYSMGEGEHIFWTINSNKKWWKLELTCEEELIKNIIE